MATRITVNGVEYRSVDEMPSVVRAEYDRMMGFLVDKDGNGVPHMLQQPEGSNTVTTRHSANFFGSVAKVETITVNGKHYDRLEDVPPELRQLIERARAAGTNRTALTGSHQTAPVITFKTNGSNGITLRLYWPTLFAALTVVGLILLGYWLMK
jgi:hypothetical protein